MRRLVRWPLKVVRSCTSTLKARYRAAPWWQTAGWIAYLAIITVTIIGDRIWPHGFFSRIKDLFSYVYMILGVVGFPIWFVWNVVKTDRERRAADLRVARISAGQCAACGYDLRATPQKCPECGQVREKATGISN